MNWIFRFLKIKNFVFLLLIFSIFNFCDLRLEANPIKSLKNFQKIYSKKHKLFIENLFFEQIPDYFVNNQNFLFANSDGEIFFYDFVHDSKNKIFDLKRFLCLDSRKNKYKFDRIEIYRVNSENFLISDGNLILFLKKNSNQNFKLEWSLKSSYQINFNSIIVKNNLLIFSKTNNTIEARNLVDGSLKWFFEDSMFRNIKIANHPVLFLKNDDLFAFFSSGKIISLKIDYGSVIFEKNLSELMKLSYSKTYIINPISDEKTRLNFENNNIILMSNNESLLIDLRNRNLNLKDTKRFQEIVYVGHNIYGIYKNNFLLKINENCFPKIFNLGFDFYKIPFKEKILSNFKGKNNDYFYIRPKIFIVNKKGKKFLMFIGSEKKDVFYFDLQKEIFIE